MYIFILGKEAGLVWRNSFYRNAYLPQNSRNDSFLTAYGVKHWLGGSLWVVSEDRCGRRKSWPILSTCFMGVGNITKILRAEHFRYSKMEHGLQSRSVTARAGYCVTCISVRCVFLCDDNDICSLWGFYAAMYGSSVPTFRDNIGPICKAQAFQEEWFLAPWRWERWVVPRLRYGATTRRCVKSPNAQS